MSIREEAVDRTVVSEVPATWRSARERVDAVAGLSHVSAGKANTVREQPVLGGMFHALGIDGNSGFAGY